MPLERLPTNRRCSIKFPETKNIHKTLKDTISNEAGHLHVLGEVEAADVRGGDDPVPGQLPDVELVHREDPVNRGHQLLLQGVNLRSGHSQHKFLSTSIYTTRLKSRYRSISA